LNSSCALVTAEAITEKQSAYLGKGGFLLVRKRKTRLSKRRKKNYPDVVQTILRRPHSGKGGGIPLTRGEVAMLFLDGHAGDGPGLLDIRSRGYG
jgi:prepilin-type processing-associated H-X9-DG protein